MLALPEMNSHQKLKLSHTWAMLSWSLDHLAAQKIRGGERTRGEKGAFAVPLVWALILTLQWNAVSKSITSGKMTHWDRYTNCLYTELRKKNLETHGGYMAAILSGSHSRTVNKHQFQKRQIFITKCYYSALAGVKSTKIISYVFISEQLHRKTQTACWKEVDFTLIGNRYSKKNT